MTTLNVREILRRRRVRRVLHANVRPMAHIASHVFGLAILGLLFVASGRIAGHAVRSRFGRPFSTTERVLAGAIGWAYFVFVLAAVGALRRAPVAVAAVAIVVTNAFIRRVEPPPDSEGDGLQESGPTGATAVAWVIAVDMIALVMTALLVLATSPQIGWDDDVAHLTLPRLWLEHGGFRPVPFNHYSHWPANSQMLYTVAMLGQDYVLAKLVHWSTLLLLLVALGREARRRTSLVLAPLAVGLVLANGVVHYEAQYAYVDLVPMVLFFAAFAFYAEWRDSGRPALLAASGMACGALAGAKLNGFVGAACIALLLALESRRRLRELATPLALLLVPTVALALPWYAKAYMETGDPLYPMLFPWLGGIEWTTELHEKFLRYHSAFGMGRSPADLLALPWRVLFQPYRFGGEGGGLSGGWIAIVPFAVAAGWKDRTARRGLIAGTLWLAVWTAGSQQIRLLLPALPLFALAATIGAFRLLGRLSAARRRVATAGLLSALATLNLFEARRTFPAAQRVVQDLLTDAEATRRRAVAPVYRAVAERTPAQARLLLLNTNHGFFLRREYVADSLFEASQTEALLLRAGSAPAVLQRLRQLGITHVLLEKADWGIAYPDYWRAVLDEAIREHTVYSDEQFVLCKLPAASKP